MKIRFHPLWQVRAVLMLAGLAALHVHTHSRAHEMFTSYIQHSVQVAVGVRHVDVVLELTFFEEWSARERASMDTDGNSRIARPELEAYVKTLASQVTGQLRLLIGGNKLDLALLYDPEVDLLGSDKVGRDHHRLRLFFFVPTPAGLRAEDEVVIEDRFWPQAKALGILHVQGRDGCLLKADKTNDPGFPPAGRGEARLFKLRCIKPPVKGVEGRAAFLPPTFFPPPDAGGYNLCSSTQCFPTA